MMKIYFSLLLLASSADALTPPQSRSSRPASPSLPAIAVPLDTAGTNGILSEEGEGRVVKLPEHDEWIAKLDYEGFGREVKALGKELLKEGGVEDAKHLDKIVAWRNIAAVVGVLTMWLPPNPLTIMALSTWTYASWTMIGHHTCHGGYNRIPDAVSKGFMSQKFALGSTFQRVKDWCDWMKPEAWNVEHNRLHHYRLNEEGDPDLVQRNLEFLRDAKRMPMFARYAFVAALTPVWKWYYYAPNTFKELKTQGTLVRKRTDDTNSA